MITLLLYFSFTRLSMLRTNSPQPLLCNNKNHNNSNKSSTSCLLISLRLLLLSHLPFLIFLKTVFLYFFKTCFCLFNLSFLDLFSFLKSLHSLNKFWFFSSNRSFLLAKRQLFVLFCDSPPLAF